MTWVWACSPEGSRADTTSHCHVGFRLPSNDAASSKDVAVAIQCLAQAAASAIGLQYQQGATTLIPRGSHLWYVDAPRVEQDSLYT